MSSPTVGRTAWDFLYEVFLKGVPWLLAVIAVGVVVYVVVHPHIANEWNVFFSTKIASIIPKKRKKTFERRVDLTLQRVRNSVKETTSEYVQKFLPYSLKVEWIEPDENTAEDTIDSVIEDKQIILYVPSFKNEEKQTVSILYNYCSKGFALKPKCFMRTEDKKATDLVVTGRLVQNAGHHVYDYFNRVYVREILEKDSTFKRNYDELKKIDVDGLFLPIFINEVDKYATRVYGSEINEKSFRTIENFKNFLIRIIDKHQEEDVNLVFHEDGISVHVELAVGYYGTEKQIQAIIKRLERIVNNRDVDTIYVIASGAKINSANEIVTGLEEKVVQEIYEPRYTQYKRYTKSSEGKDSICYEINIR